MSSSAYQKSTRLVLILALLAWAMQMVWAHCAQGAELDSPSEEKFAQSGEGSSSHFTAGRHAGSSAVLELRSEVTIIGGEVKLKQICRWSDGDKAAFEPVADLVVARLKDGTAFRAITITELRSLLGDAGVNLAIVRFAGATHCTIARSDLASDEQGSLQEWVNARLAAGASTQPSKQATAVAAPAAGTAIPAASLLPADRAQSKSLRDLLIADLAERLSLSPDSLQVHFAQSDEKVLKLAEPLFHFNIDGQRIHNLGEVTWEVTILSDGAKGQKTMIRAAAKAWQDQLVTRIPLGYHQEFRGNDIVEKRALIDLLETDPPVTRDQVVGQQASRELRAGTVLTARLVEATPLARIGDLINVTLAQGNVQITTVGRAMEGGSYGQTIRVKHEVSGAIYDVTLTALKAGRMTPVSAAPEAASATTAE